MAKKGTKDADISEQKLGAECGNRMKTKDVGVSKQSLVQSWEHVHLMKFWKQASVCRQTGKTGHDLAKWKVGPISGLQCS